MARFISFISLFISLYIPTDCTAAALPAEPAMPPLVDYSPMREEMAHLITKKMRKNDTTGLSIAVIDDQQIVWAEGFGWADKKNKRKATPETVYRVGSITKLFTVSAAMQLVEQGKMALDQPLQEVLPGFRIKSRSNDTDKITIHNIMTHHSGLPGDYAHGMWGEKPEDFTRLVNVLKNEYTAYPPDTIFCYSNLAMTLLGHAVQETVGQPYGEVIQQKLLTPLGMKDSYIANTLRDEPQSSKGYSDDEESPAMPLRDTPAGGLQSTVLDLARFAEMIFAGGRSGEQQILHTETIAKMMRFQDGDAPFDVGHQIGLGWFLQQQSDKNGSLSALHGGDTSLFHSMLITLPQHKLAVVVLANSESSQNIVIDIAEHVLHNALAVKTGIKLSANKSASLAELPTPPEDLENFPGYYSTDDGLITIKRNDDKLQASSDGDTLDLILHEDGQYYLQYKLFGLWLIDMKGLNELGITHAKINGREVLLAKFRGQKMLFAEKIIPRPIPDAWKQRTGIYKLLNPNTGESFEEIELSIENGLLQAGDDPKSVLQVVDDENAIIHGLGSGLGDTVRVVYHNGDELLAWSGYLFRRIK